MSDAGDGERNDVVERVRDGVRAARERLGDSTPDSVEFDQRRLANLLPDRIQENLTAKLLTVLLLGALVSASIGAVAFVSISGELTTQVEGQAHSATSLQANVYGSWFEGKWETMEEVESSEFVQSGATQVTKSKSLQGYRSQAEDFNHLYVANFESGEVFASTNDDAVGANVYELAAINRSGFNGEMYLSPEPVVVQESSEPVTVFALRTFSATPRVVVGTVPASASADVRQVFEGSTTTLRSTSGTRLLGDDGETRVEMPATVAANATVVDSNGALYGFERITYSSDAGEVSAVVTTRVPKSAAFAIRQQVTRDVGVTLALTIGLLIGTSIVGMRVVTGSITDLATRARAVSHGEFNTTVQTDRQDELGTLYTAVREMRDSLQDRIEEAETAVEEATEAKSDAEQARETAERAQREAERLSDHLEQTATEYSEVMETFAEGDLTVRMDPDEESEALARIARSFNDAIEDVAEIVADVQRFADDVSERTTEVASGAAEIETASGEVSEQTQGISHRIDSQVGTMNDVVAEMETISATIEEMSASASELASTSEQAVTRVREGRDNAETAMEEVETIDEEIEDLVEQVESLEEWMDEIGDIADVISEIAEQTNMLALNANIEAARAGGDSGDGFSVVAAEVKSLAEEAQESTGEIRSVIEQVQTNTRDTVDATSRTRERITRSIDTIQEALQAFDDVEAAVDETNTGVSEIDDATASQADSTQEVSAMVTDAEEISRDVDGTASDVAAAAEEQAAAVSEITQSVSALRERAEALQETVASSFTVERDEDVDAVAAED
jgi:methyl-accepting chemotaxis protein